MPVKMEAVTIEWIRLLLALVGLSSGLLTVLTMLLRKEVFTEKKITEEHRDVIALQHDQLRDAQTVMTTEVRALRSDLDHAVSQVVSLKTKLVEQIEQLEAIKQAFGGYFEIVRKRLESTESRLQVVESQTEQVIHVGKELAARIRGKVE